MGMEDAVQAVSPDETVYSLTKFVPRFQAARLAARAGLPARAKREDGWGALLFVDIAGFTAMTERLGTLGPRGVEQMSGLLNEHYGALTDLISQCSGDVVAYAGDAVLALWPAEREAGLADATRTAAACGLQIQELVAGRNLTADQPLAVRAALGAGPVSRFELGGEGGSWFWLVAGEAVEQAAQADSLAQPGQVVLAPRAADLLEADEIERLPNGALRLRALAAAAPGPAAGSEPGPFLLQTGPSSVDPAGIEAGLAAFVPDVVRQRVRARQSDFLAEFRHVAVGFAGIETSGDLEELQHAVSVVQQVLERFGGALYQCLRDDKGFVVIMVFGMPPHAHENDTERALLASLAVREALPGSVSIGVAAGRVFCGAYGGASRQQYSLVGPTMNLAARLMQAADGGVLCDETTAGEARDQVELAPREPLMVKGRAEPVVVFEPSGRRLTPGQPQQGSIVGRAGELAALSAHVGALVSSSQERPRSQSRVTPAVIEAEAGMGKSTLVGSLVQAAQAQGIRVVVGGADALETHTAYYPFRAVLAQFLEQAADPDARLAELLAGSSLAAYASLLNPLRPGRGVEEDPRTRSLSAAARADRTNQLLLHVFRACSEATPTLLVLEDVHWMDSASWALAQQVGSLLSGCALVVTTRPLDEGRPELAALYREAGALRTELSSLDALSLAQLVAGSLGVKTLPEAFSRLIVERAGGNPFYAQELAYSLRDAGVVAIENGRLRVIAPDALDASALPETLQGVITSRVDALSPPEQLTLKVASVIGREFEAGMLVDVHPQTSRVEDLADALEGLTRAALVEAEPESDGSHGYRFRHAVIQDSVYALLPYDQRRSLHRAAAAHLEHRYAEDRNAVLPRLAHHYGEAEMPSEAMAASRDAGSQAVDRFANREAVRFLRGALEFEAASDAKPTRLERTTLHNQLTNAYYGLTDYERTIEHAWQAVREAGYAAPAGGWAIPKEFGILLLQGVRERRQGRRERALEGARREERLMAMSSLSSAMSALIFLGRRAEYLEIALKLHNLGAGLEPSPESAACRSALGFCFAMLGWKGRAEVELRRALAEAQQVAAPENLGQCYMLLAMFQHMQGELSEAIEYGANACEIFENEIEAGMWRHRARMSYTASLAHQGLLDEAVESYGMAGAFMQEAEPQAYGLVLALQGLTLLHAGKAEEAQPLLEGGVHRSRDHDSAFPLFVALGALAELELRKGRMEQAVAIAFEAEASARKSGEVNSYLQGGSGYAGICMVFCEMLASPQAYAPGSSLHHSRVRRHARQASRRFKRFAATFVCFEPLYLALEGLRQHRLGARRRARKAWSRARERAVSMGLPYEQQLAEYFLGCEESGREMHAWGDETVVGAR